MSEQGAVYLDYITSELEGEWKRREALDRRGTGIVTATSSFTTFVLGVAALLIGTDHVIRSPVGVTSTVLALVLLLAAGLFGLLGHRPRTYDVPDAHGYLQLLESDHWKDNETDARSAVAKLRLKTLGTLRAGNNGKVRDIQVALALQLLGVVALCIAIGSEVVTSL